jgi:excisionase family DNA binding protein
MAPTRPDAEGLLTCQEAARFLKVRPSFLYAETRRGTNSSIPFARVGRYVRFRRDQLERWLDERTVGGANGRGPEGRA